MKRVGTCLECGFDWAASPAELRGPLEGLADRFAESLGRVDDEHLRTRPRPEVWSPLEYVAHTRDVLAWYEGRISRVLEEDRPRLTAVGWARATDERDYHGEATDEVLSGLEEAAESLRGLLAALTADQWSRIGIGSEGHDRDVLMLARRAVHEAAHHLVDVERSGGAHR